MLIVRGIHNLILIIINYINYIKPVAGNQLTRFQHIIDTGGKRSKYKDNVKW
jgi:hypothetical protein